MSNQPGNGLIFHESSASVSHSLASETLDLLDSGLGILQPLSVGLGLGVKRIYFVLVG